MTSGPAAPADPLAPLREALLARARTDADATLARADEAARATVEQAQAEAAAILAEARAKGAQEADAVAAAERARASRAAREVVMTAQRQAYEALRDQARSAVAELRRDDAYPHLRDALTARVHAELGAEAVVEELPDGGVVGRVPGRSLRFALADLADHLVDRLGGAADGVWSP